MLKTQCDGCIIDIQTKMCQLMRREYSKSRAMLGLYFVCDLINGSIRSITLYVVKSFTKAIIVFDDWNIIAIKNYIGTTISCRIRMGVLCLVFVMIGDFNVMVFIIKMYVGDNMVPIISIGG